MAKQIRTHYDFGKVGELRNALWHKTSTAPTSPATGQFYYDTATNRAVINNGAWKSLAHLDEIVDNTSAQTVAGVKTFSSFPVTPSSDPTTAYQVTNKQYVDNAISAAVAGIDNKQEARVGTTAALTITAKTATTLTLGGTALTIDGVTLQNGDWVLVKDGTSGASGTAGSSSPENGLYSVSGIGTSVALTRVSVADVWAELRGMFVFVLEGTANALNGYIASPAVAGTLGTNAVPITQFSGAGQITAGAGMTKTGNTLDIGAGTGITVNANDVAIDTSVVARKATGLIGDGSATSYVFSHNLGNQWVHVQVVEVATLELVEVDVDLTSANTCTIIFASAPASNAYRVIVIG